MVLGTSLSYNLPSNIFYDPDGDILRLNCHVSFYEGNQNLISNITDKESNLWIKFDSTMNLLYGTPSKTDVNKTNKGYYG
jgi:hypothetical protein